MASAVARVLAVFAAAVACGMSGTASASGNATAKYTPGVPPSESSMVNFYYQMEQAMSTYLWSKSPITDDLACFYGDVPGPEGNRVQAAVASGKSLNDMGNYDMCNHANGTQYCTVTIGYNNLSVTGIRMGFCVAKTCNESQLSFVVNDLINIVAPSIDPFIYINNATVHCPQDPGPVRPALYVAIAINAVLLVLCIVGTWMKWPKSIPPQSVSADTSHDGALSRPLMDVAKDAPEPQPVAERKPKNALEHIVFAFDIVTNWKKLMVKPVDERLACLNGVRALSMFWIIYSHTFFNALQANFMNSMYMLPPDGYTTGYAFEMVPGGYFAVDAFFWLGGFLVVFALVGQINLKGRGPPLHLVYILRFVRIVPSYMYFLLMFVGVLLYVGDGPLWYMVEEHTAPCLTNWWTNLLFINNFYPTNTSEACMDWSWYLANDMQFFIITPFLIWTYHKSKAAGIAVCLVLLAASTGITAWLVIGGTTLPDGTVLPKDLSSSSLSPNNPDFVVEVYTKPYCRIQSYLIGILTGYANDMLKVRDSPKKRINIWVDGILTVVASAVCWVCVFGEQGQYSETPSPWTLAENVLYNSLSKIAFSVGLGVLCLLCISGNARFINWFLTWWIWNPLARLTFGAYLVHPILMDLFYTSSRVVLYWDLYFMPQHFCFFVVSAYICSAGQFFLVERPLMTMLKLCKGGGKKKKPKDEFIQDEEAPKH